MAKVFLVFIAAGLVQCIAGAPAAPLSSQGRPQRQFHAFAPVHDPRPTDLTNALETPVTSPLTKDRSSASYPAHHRLGEPVGEPPKLNRSARALPYASFHCQEQVLDAGTEPEDYYRNHHMGSLPRTMNCSLLMPYLPTTSTDPLQPDEKESQKGKEAPVGSANTFQLTPGSSTLLEPALKSHSGLRLILNLVLPTQTAEDREPESVVDWKNSLLLKPKAVSKGNQTASEEPKVPAASSLSLVQKNSRERKYLGNRQSTIGIPRNATRNSSTSKTVSKLREYKPMNRPAKTSKPLLVVSQTAAADTLGDELADQGAHVTTRTPQRASESSLAQTTPTSNVMRAGKRGQATILEPSQSSSDVKRLRSSKQATRTTTTLSPVTVTRSKRPKSNLQPRPTTTTTTTPEPEPETVLPEPDGQEEESVLPEPKEQDESEDEVDADGEAEGEDASEDPQRVAIQRFRQAYEKTYREVERFMDEDKPQPVVGDPFESEDSDEASWNLPSMPQYKPEPFVAFNVPPPVHLEQHYLYDSSAVDPLIGSAQSIARAVRDTPYFDSLDHDRVMTNLFQRRTGMDLDPLPMRSIRPFFPHSDINTGPQRGKVFFP